MIDSQETPPQPIQHRTMSRRQFNRIAATTLLAVPAAAIGSTDFDLIPPRKELSEVLIGDGRKVKLILGRHDGPLETRIESEDFSPPIAYIFLDSSDDREDPNFTADMDWYIGTTPTRPFLQEAFRLVRDESVPLIFGDSPLSDRDVDVAIQKSDNRHLIAILSSALAGLGLSIDALNNKLTRREFLRGTARLAVSVGSISSVYFSSDTLAEAAARLGAIPQSDTAKELMAIFSDLIHPDNYIIVMRNIIWALKNIDIFDQKIFPIEQIAHVLGGGDHRFVEFFLKHPDIAKKYFQTFQYKKVIERLWPREKRDWVYKSLIYRYKGEPKYIYHQTLQTLIAE